MIVLTVAAEPHGWRLTSEPPCAEGLFRTGADAERAARQQARSLASAGHFAKLVIRLKSGRLAGSILFQPNRPELSLAV